MKKLNGVAMNKVAKSTAKIAKSAKVVAIPDEVPDVKDMKEEIKMEKVDSCINDVLEKKPPENEFKEDFLDRVAGIDPVKIAKDIMDGFGTKVKFFLRLGEVCTAMSKWYDTIHSSRMAQGAIIDIISRLKIHIKPIVLELRNDQVLMMAMKSLQSSLSIMDILTKYLEEDIKGLAEKGQECHSEEAKENQASDSKVVA